MQRRRPADHVLRTPQDEADLKFDGGRERNVKKWGGSRLRIGQNVDPERQLVDVSVCRDDSGGGCGCGGSEGGDGYIGDGGCGRG
jgi:hypothetical protein